MTIRKSEAADQTAVSVLTPCDHMTQFPDITQFPQQKTLGQAYSRTISRESD